MITIIIHEFLTIAATFTRLDYSVIYYTILPSLSILLPLYCSSIDVHSNEVHAFQEQQQAQNRYTRVHRQNLAKVEASLELSSFLAAS